MRNVRYQHQISSISYKQRVERENSQKDWLDDDDDDDSDLIVMRQLIRIYKYAHGQQAKMSSMVSMSYFFGMKTEVKSY